MQIELLADHPHHIPELSKWYYEMWGQFMEGVDLQVETERTRSYAGRDGPPLILIALEEDELLGAIQLRHQELAIRKNYAHWLSGLYIKPSHRGQGLSEALIDALKNKAASLGIHALYLQTEHPTGGIYRRHGFQPVEWVRDHGIDLLLMHWQKASPSQP